MEADSTQNLIVLSDGTGNSASKQNKTNVWRLYQAIDLSDGTQVAEFADGVGTSGVRILRVLGLALGVGVKRNVLNLYKFLCRNYKTGDRIWALGFSRGAFTIRMLVRLIEYEGLVSFEDEAELNRNALAAYRAYRKKAFATLIPWVFFGRLLRDWLISARNAMRRSYPHWEITTDEKPGPRSYVESKKETVRRKETDKKETVKEEMLRLKRDPVSVKVHFVGVWDTVVAYGLPIDELTQAVDLCVWPMKYRRKKNSALSSWGLSPIVLHARHALSLDDERTTFHPICWDEMVERRLVAKSEVKPGRLQQVWFAGAHADVGGGYPDAGLSFVPLVWMIREAEGKGLRFGRSVVEGYAANATATGRIYDSRAGFFAALWRYHPRDAHLLLNPPRDAHPPLDEDITPLVDGSVMDPPRDAQNPPRDTEPPHIRPLVHGSVMIRMACGNGYAPISLPQEINVLVPDGPPVLFDAAAVAQALAQGDGDEKQRRILLETQHLLTAASANTEEPTKLFDLVWDTVWCRRIVYFVSLAFVVAAVAFPLLAQYLRIKGVTDPFNETAGGPVVWIPGLIRGPVHWILDVIKGFLPWFTKPWVAAVVRYPLQAATVLIGLILSLWFSRILERSICNRARVAWNVRMRGQDRAKSVGPPKPGWWLLTLARTAWATTGRRLLNLVHKLRTNRLALGGYKSVAQYGLPGLFLVVSVILVLSLGNSAAFGVRNTIGVFCTSTKEVKDASPEKEILGAGKTFETRSMCHATGLRLIAGGKYRIRLDMDEGVNGKWFDKGVPADVTGFTAVSMRHYAGFTGWRYYLGWPLKRWWRENWFQPIARIGEVGNYEHVLLPAAPMPVVSFEQCRPKEEKRLSWWEAITSPATGEFKNAWLECELGKHIRPNRVLISDITADATGELFLYVNDAVLTPGLTDVFYRNNSGTAKVTVTRILAESIIEAPIKE